MNPQLRKTAKQAVKTASLLCQQIQHSLKADQTHTKEDRSPVTVADYASQAIVSLMLQQEFPEIPIVAEEELKDLRDPALAHITIEVLRLVKSVLPATSDEAIFSAIGRCTHERPTAEQYWTLDPIDGTKGFLRGNHYAVSLALIEQDQVTMGMLGAPNMSAEPAGDGEGNGALFIAERGKGVWSQALDSSSEQKLQPPKACSRACEPMESKHTARDVSGRVQQALGLTDSALLMDSQCKYAAVGTGLASLYLRLPSSKPYREKVWDHAGGALIVEEMGGTVTDAYGEPLPMGTAVLFPPSRGVVASLGLDHDRVIAAIREAQDTAAV